MHTTTRLGLDVPDSIDNESAYPAVAAQAMGVLDNAVLVTEGTLVGRPAANTVEKDHIYKATDTGVWYIGDGTNWNTLMVAGAWTALTLAASFTGSAFARRVGDTVELEGFATNGTGSAFSGTLLTGIPWQEPGTWQRQFNVAVTASPGINSCFIFNTGGSTSNLVAGTIPAAIPNGATVYFDGLSYRLS